MSEYAGFRCDECGKLVPFLEASEITTPLVFRKVMCDKCGDQAYNATWAYMDERDAARRAVGAGQ